MKNHCILLVLLSVKVVSMENSTAENPTIPPTQLISLVESFMNIEDKKDITQFDVIYPNYKDPSIMHTQKRTEYVTVIRQFIKQAQEPSYTPKETIRKMRDQLDLTKPLMPQATENDLMHLQKGMLRGVTQADSHPTLEQNSALKEFYLDGIKYRNRLLELLENHQTLPDQIVQVLTGLKGQSISTEAVLQMYTNILRGEIPNSKMLLLCVPCHTHTT